MSRYSKTPPISKKRKLFRLLKALIKKPLILFSYPHSMAKKYKQYHKEIGIMFAEVRDAHLRKLRGRIGILLNTFIYLPIFVGFLASFVSIHSHTKDFTLYYRKVKRPIYAKTILKKATVVYDRVVFATTKIPLNRYDLGFFLGGYFFAFIGALILSLNPAFKRTDEIRKKFKALNLVDERGEPWGLTWTPDALMITSFNSEAKALVNRGAFWSTINFSPSRPRVFKEDKNKFIVFKRYELPYQVMFDKAEIEDKKPKDEKEASDGN